MAKLFGDAGEVTDQRDVVLLRVVAGLSVDETARAVGRRPMAPRKENSPRTAPSLRVIRTARSKGANLPPATVRMPLCGVLNMRR